MNPAATQDLAEVLACPRCDRGLQSYPDGSFGCLACGVKFPRLGGIPCLYADPAASLAEWRGRWHFAVERLGQEADEAKAALQNPRLRPLARERLQRQVQSRTDQARRLRELLAPLGLHLNQAGLTTHLALRTRLPPDQGLTTYEANIHRDWAWGEAENAAALRLVAGCLPAGAATVLVSGAGAGRLAYDLHQSSRAGLSVALDFNPLLALVARRAAGGETTSLWEFPLAPRTLADHAVLRELAAPAPAREGLEVLLGDALRPPFRSGAFDVVVTPWVVDILPEDFRFQAARINGLLAPGGRWICFGSLAFAGPDPARRYGFEEVLAMVEEAGFGAPVVREEDIPYLCSPSSRHGRRETVVTLAADKSRAVARPPRPQALPDWLVEGTRPVPLLPAFQMQAMTTRIYSFIMGLIDGRRSVKDMARLLVDQRLMTREEAEPAVRTFLTRMYDDSQRPPGL